MSPCETSCTVGEDCFDEITESCTRHIHTAVRAQVRQENTTITSLSTAQRVLFKSTEESISMGAMGLTNPRGGALLCTVLDVQARGVLIESLEFNLAYCDLPLLFSMGITGMLESSAIPLAFTVAATGTDPLPLGSIRNVRATAVQALATFIPARSGGYADVTGLNISETRISSAVPVFHCETVLFTAFYMHGMSYVYRASGDADEWCVIFTTPTGENFQDNLIAGDHIAYVNLTDMFGLDTSLAACSATTCAPCSPVNLKTNVIIIVVVVAAGIAVGITFVCRLVKRQLKEKKKQNME